MAMTIDLPFHLASVSARLRAGEKKNSAAILNFTQSKAMKKPLDAPITVRVVAHTIRALFRKSKPLVNEWFARTPEGSVLAAPGRGTEKLSLQRCDSLTLLFAKTFYLPSVQPGVFLVKSGKKRTRNKAGSFSAYLTERINSLNRLAYFLFFSATIAATATTARAAAPIGAAAPVFGLPSSTTVSPPSVEALLLQEQWALLLRRQQG